MTGGPRRAEPSVEVPYHILIEVLIGRPKPVDEGGLLGQFYGSE